MQLAALANSIHLQLVLYPVLDLTRLELDALDARLSFVCLTSVPAGYRSLVI